MDAGPVIQGAIALGGIIGAYFAGQKAAGIKTAQLETRMDAHDKEIDRLRDNQHDLRDQLPEMIERTVRMLR